MAFSLHGATPGRYVDDRTRPAAICGAVGGPPERHPVQASDRARPDLPRQGARGAADPVDGGDGAAAVPLRAGDPQGRRLQGDEGPLRRRAVEEHHRCARRGAAAGAAAGKPGRAVEGHRRCRHLPVGRRRQLRPRHGDQAFGLEPGVSSRRPGRIGHEPGQVQFAAGRPEGHDRQDHRSGRGGEVRQDVGRGGGRGQEIDARQGRPAITMAAERSSPR